LGEEEEVSMPRPRENQGAAQGFQFIHEDPLAYLATLSPTAGQWLQEMGLHPFMATLTRRYDMQACIDAKRSYHPTPNLILVNRPNGMVYEIVLSVELIQLALLLSRQGATIGKTEPIKRDIIPYFQPLVGTYRDGLPIDKIVDPDIRQLAQIISHFLELSRGVRVKQIHGRFFYPIFKWLAQREPVNWATMV